MENAATGLTFGGNTTVVDVVDAEVVVVVGLTVVEVVEPGAVVDGE